MGLVRIYANGCGGGGGGGVTQICQGTGICINPACGTGVVTICATGGGGSGIVVLDSGINSSVRCGSNNCASGNYSTALGGCNQAIANYGTISGGYSNCGDGYASTISGGYGNHIITQSNYATISGGYNNTASGYNVTIGGGEENTNCGNYGVINGGRCNTIANLATDSIVGGGFRNVIAIFLVAITHLSVRVCVIVFQANVVLIQFYSESQIKFRVHRFNQPSYRVCVIA